jgi:hypothetical protein
MPTKKKNTTKKTVKAKTPKTKAPVAETVSDPEKGSTVRIRNSGL